MHACMQSCARMHAHVFTQAQNEAQAIEAAAKLAKSKADEAKKPKTLLMTMGGTRDAQSVDSQRKQCCLPAYARALLRSLLSSNR